MRTLNLLVYADVNLNIMDGSSVWLAELLALIGKDPRINLDFLSKAPNQGGPLNEQVDKLETVNRLQESSRIMKPDEAALAIKKLDKEKNYDRVLVRGNIEMGKELIEFLPGRLVYYTLEPFQKIDELTENQKQEVGRLLNATAFAIVQSDRMRSSYSQQFEVPYEHIYILPPLIPPIMKRPAFRNRLNSVCYTGKFSEEWGTPDLTDVFKGLREKLPYAKLNIAGNKFHGELAGRKQEIQTFFENGDGVNWVGVVSRQESISLSRDSDIGFALRSSVIDNDNSQELSTKLFEYMSSAKPVILRPTKVHKDLLGEDYPLFANSNEEAIDKIASAFTDVGLYAKAADMSYTAYKRFAESVNHDEIIERLLAYKKKTILFAGHDLKFLRDVIASYEQDANYDVLIDNWQGHTKHNAEESLSKLAQADVIFCEWGLGNIRWYSNHKKAGQKLLVRIHLQENRVPQYLEEADLNNIDKFIFIAPYRYEEFVEMHNLPREKCKLVFNTVDCERFALPKNDDAAFTLGFIGMVPWRKRFDLALDIFESLWKKDNRYKLRVKGKTPHDYPWMKGPNFADEFEKYEALDKRIAEAPWKDNVIFDGHGDDMPEWFRGVGYILSTSDFEGSHQAVAEGMASGAVPIILPWAGAETVYPKKYIHQDEYDEHKNKISNPESELLRLYADTHFDTSKIVHSIRNLIST